LSNNQLSGTIPFLPSTLKHLDLSLNQLSGPLLTLEDLDLDWLSLAGNQLNGSISVTIARRMASLHLDLSHNRLEGPIPGFTALPRSSWLDLSFNLLSDILPLNASIMADYVDLTSNKLAGMIPYELFPHVTKLKLANNGFGNGITSLQLPKIQELDISYNNFEFDVYNLGHMTELVMLNASCNRLYGQISLVSLPNLKILDLSHNDLGRVFNLTEIGAAYNQSLQYLSIKHNPLLPVFENIPSASRLTRTTERHPLQNASNVDCFTLAFPYRTLGFFGYDEDLFGWQQCECNVLSFGIPPSLCFPCPANGLCAKESLTIPHNQFAYHVDSSLTGSPVALEECVPSAEESISNCHGMTYKVNSSFDIPKTQCKVGSSGRLCARCDCDPSRGLCWFHRGPSCIQCKKLLSHGESIAIALVVVLIGLVALSGVMFMVLRSKRQAKEKHWADLPILKKLVYRVTYTISVGGVPILVNFVQVLVEVSHWDELAIQAWVRLANGNVEGIGLRCMIPMMSDPMIALVGRLMLPLGVAALVMTSIGIGELVYRMRQNYVNRRRIIGGGGDDDESAALIGHGSDSQTYVKSSTPYPAMALVASTTISLVQFFYFGTALTATEYFFGSRQALSGMKYVQAHPWMHYDGALRLRLASVPFLVVYVLGWPLIFIYLAWMIRDRVKSSSTSIYYGTLFGRYKARWYWWEIVLVVRKLAIALVIRGIEPSNAFQMGLVIIFIAVVHVAQSNILPWRRESENRADSMSAFLLLGAIFSVHFDLGHLHQAGSFTTTVLVLCLLYVLGLVVLIFVEGVTGRTDYEEDWDEKHFAQQQMSVQQNNTSLPTQLLSEGWDSDASSRLELSSDSSMRPDHLRGTASRLDLAN
jgi:hypothetical protein